MSAPTEGVTALLLAWRAGDDGALERLIPLVYDELRRMARRYMKGERSDHTLQATALVHEAFGRLVDARVAWDDRAHFLAVAARAMRRILVDHAKARNRDKRGAGQRPRSLSLDVAATIGPVAAPELIDLDRALERLEALDERKGRAVELHYFGGLSYEETAAVLEVSTATLHRDLRMAKAWLATALTENEAP